MKIQILIEEDGMVVTVSKTIEGDLSEVAKAVTTAVTSAFEYPVECTLSTDMASFGPDGFIA